MTDNELLVLVKAGIGVSGTSQDARILQKLKAAKGIMTNYGIDAEDIDSDEGVECVTTIVQDLLNAAPGETKLSYAAGLVMTQLHHKALPEIEE